ncbi:hypothetical protein CYMTET_25070, partial [Cymbomonas tetramitiformis]
VPFLRTSGSWRTPSFRTSSRRLICVAAWWQRWKRKTLPRLPSFSFGAFPTPFATRRSKWPGFYRGEAPSKSTSNWTPFS